MYIVMFRALSPRGNLRGWECYRTVFKTKDAANGQRLRLIDKPNEYADAIVHYVEPE